MEEPRNKNISVKHARLYYYKGVVLTSKQNKILPENKNCENCMKLIFVDAEKEASIYI